MIFLTIFVITLNISEQSAVILEMQRTLTSVLGKQLDLSKVKTGLTCNLVQDTCLTHQQRVQSFHSFSGYAACWNTCKKKTATTLKNCPEGIRKGLKMTERG